MKYKVNYKTHQILFHLEPIINQRHDKKIISFDCGDCNIYIHDMELFKKFISKIESAILLMDKNIFTLGQ